MTVPTGCPSDQREAQRRNLLPAGAGKQQIPFGFAHGRFLVAFALSE
ncbi:MAG: hypothetical protein WB523_15320 [Candidatus Sulfotelmatobacter sp.]